MFRYLGISHRLKTDQFEENNIKRTRGRIIQLACVHISSDRILTSSRISHKDEEPKLEFQSGSSKVASEGLSFPIESLSVLVKSSWLVHVLPLLRRKVVEPLQK